MIAKLVRDRIPEILDRQGIVYESHVASQGEYRAALIKKLVEEAHEFAVAGSPEELADVLEVVDELKKLSEYDSVMAIQRAKQMTRGGFNQRIIVQIPPGQKGGK